MHAVLAICINEDKGGLNIGGFDGHYSYSDFYIYPVLYNNRYSVQITQVLLNDKVLNINVEGRINLEVPYIYLPFSEILWLIQALAEFYGDSCQQALCEVEGHVFFGNTLIRPPAFFPNITVSIGGFKIVLGGFLNICSDNQYCSVIRSGGDFAIIGSPILEKVYLVIDMENSKIALANLKKCEQTDEIVLLHH